MERSVIGIDIGKYELVVYWNKQYETLCNDSATLIKWLNKNRSKLSCIDLIVFEATGGYERELKKCLLRYELPFRQVHANHVRAFAKASGIEAKTDKIDAKIIAEYALRMDVQLKVVKEINEGLKVLLTRRKQLIDMRQQEKNRLDTGDQLLAKWINKNITYLDRQIEQVEKAIDVHAKEDAETKRLYELYSSIPGVGKITGLQLTVDLPELLEENDKTLAALVGLAPWNHDSGRMRGRRRTRGGRSQIRGLLYMAALVAARCNPEMKQFYNKLKSKGKASKVALIAVAHKLLMILRSVAQRGTPWVPAV